MFKITICLDQQRELNDTNSEVLTVSRIPNLDEWIITPKFGSNIVIKVCSIFANNTESYIIII